MSRSRQMKIMESKNSNIPEIIEELEKILQKEGLSGERAYLVLCDSLLIKAYVEEKEKSSIFDLLGDKNIEVEVENLFEAVTQFYPDIESNSYLKKISNDRLEEIMCLIDRLNIMKGEIDLFGYFYGHFFSDIFKGKSGKFFTPRSIVKGMVRLGGPRREERVCDPACGSGGFLVESSKEVDNNLYLVGNDIDPLLVKTSKINLHLLKEKNFEIKESNLFRGSFIQEYRNSFNLILANPPFSLVYSSEEISDEFVKLKRKKRLTSDYLFLESAYKLLEQGGRIVSLFPYSLITNPEHLYFRKLLKEKWTELACLTLPEGVFYPFSGSSSRACILMLVKSPDSDYYSHPSLKANINKVGYDLDRKHYTPLLENDFHRLFQTEAYSKFTKVRKKALEELN